MYGHHEGGSRGGGFRSFAPVKVGDELDVTIEAVGAKGDGIAKKNGFVLFVPGVKEGQHVRIRITKVLRKVGFAELVGEAEAPPEGSEESEAPVETEGEEPAPEEGEEEPLPEDSESFGEEETQESEEQQ